MFDIEEKSEGYKTSLINTLQGEIVVKEINNFLNFTDGNKIYCKLSKIKLKIISGYLQLKGRK